MFRRLAADEEKDVHVEEQSSDGARAGRVVAEQSIAQRLRQLILSRQLTPGERLVQSELAQRFGVSRTPIREALRELVSDGLVTILPHKGASVAKFLLADVEEIYAIRIALEGYAAHLAALHITEEELQKLDQLLCAMDQAFREANRSRLLHINREFDTTIYAASRQEKLYELIVRHIDLADLYRRLYFSLDHLAAGTVDEHREILEALKRRDPQEAERLSRIALERTVAGLVEFIASEP